MKATSKSLTMLSSTLMLVAASCLLVLFSTGQDRMAFAQAADSEPQVKAGVKDVRAEAINVISTYCVSCHGADKQDGGIRLDHLELIDSVQLQEVFLLAQDAVHFEEMPPKKAKQPTESERRVLLEWLGAQLSGDAAKKLKEKLRRPESGNYIDHDELFSGDHADKPGYTEDRRWLISEYIFDDKFNRVLKHKPWREIDGKRRSVIGDSKRFGILLTNPFRLPGHQGGVRYYANDSLNGGHLLTMLTNAKDASEHMLYLSTRDRSYLPAIGQILADERANQATLKARQDYLDKNIEHVLEEIYQGKHAAMLPKFDAKQVIPPAPAVDPNQKKVRIGAASPGRDEEAIIIQSLLQHDEQTQTDEQFIAKAVEGWFYHGHSDRKIQTRIVFMRGYLDELRQQLKNPKYQSAKQRLAYAPLSPDQMGPIVEAIRKHRKPGDRFNEIIAKCVEQWEAEFEQQRIAAGPPDEAQTVALVEQLYQLILESQPTPDEAEKYAALTRSYVKNLGRENTIKKLIQTLLLDTRFVYRSEFGQGEADEHGRRMLSPRDASYAIAYALTDSSPDQALVKAVEQGRLNTREDYEREVRRMLADRSRFYVVDETIPHNKGLRSYGNFTTMPVREHRFFREFFGYPKLLTIFKDNKRFGGQYERAGRRLVNEADLLVGHILESDQNVIEQFLTSDEYYVYHSGNNDAMRAGSERIRKIYDYFKDMPWRDFTLEDLAKHRPFLMEMELRGVFPKNLEPKRDNRSLRGFKTQMESFELRLGNGQKAAAPYNSFAAHGKGNAPSRLGGSLASPEVARFYNIDLANWDYPTEQPTKVPNRKGMLTHPAWLIAFSANFETDPIHRGKWIQEKLLAGTIPDVPITVDAVIPEDPHKTLRQRMIAKTGNDYCWTCHQKMEPLGLPFEMYDDFGRFRTEERLEYPENLIKEVKGKGQPHEDTRDIYKTLPVDSTGFLEGSGDSALDGEVTDALDLIDRLAKSDRVRQSIIRHAFRFFLGRNETLSDSKTLIDADRAYLESGGSFDEVIVSLLTSDSFIFRKAAPKED